ncbi:MAG: hypothetical protein IJ800_07365, partial [Clostridia bacterium]|nr:hypothetical protein [Clostridia bacterium]
QSPFSFNQQKDFLRAYLRNSKKILGENCLEEKAVSDSEIKDCAKKTGREVVLFSAYKRKKTTEYEGWQLYTDRATINDQTLVLTDNYCFPVPCAKYEFCDALQSLTLNIKVSGEYYHKSAEGILPTTTGRVVELRCGCKEVIKLFLSPDGQIIFKDSRNKKYHYEIRKIGDYPFDKWFELTIRILQTGVSIEYNGEEHQFSFSCCGNTDNIFFSGGMQPVGNWQIKPEFHFLSGEKRTFKSISAIESSEEYLGEVSLPFGIGTEKNKDEILILKRKFNAEKNKCYTLEIGALDPCGDVFINDTLALHMDNFQPTFVDITPFLINGENELKLEIYPRAPEVLYPWHRHDDYYNAWFALEVKLHKGQVAKQSELNAYATKISKTSEINVKWDHGVIRNGCFYRVLLKKSYPIENEWTVLTERSLNGIIEDKFKVSIQKWQPETPILYAVRAEIFDKSGIVIESEIETGFRTIEQNNGAIYLNGARIVLKGALNMQFLPPYNEIPLNHLCPTDAQIIEQVLAIKKMNGNCMRMHQLGYGCNDKRFARICDRLGILLIWTTRLIDSAENMMWTESWKQKCLYQKQMQYVINHPSIIIWEGSNELHTDRKTLDRVYDEFVTAIKEIDNTRLLSPVSHLYYGGGLYDYGCEYYDTKGERDEQLRPAISSFGWRDNSVVRSAHTYALLLGYGAPWQDMVNQNWRLQPELFNDDQKAYLVSEYAIIGRQNPNTKEAQEFINKDSYELPDEKSAFGKCFTDDEWDISQAFQALCCDVATKQLLRYDADGMLWCCLWGGANNASYLKPIVDFYGYKKLAYYSLQQAFQETICFNEHPDVIWSENYEIHPLVYGLIVGKRYAVIIDIADQNGYIIQEKKYPIFNADSTRKKLIGWKPKLKDGYYSITYKITSI